MRRKVDDRMQQKFIDVVYDAKKRRKEKRTIQKQMSKMFDTELNIIIDVTDMPHDWRFIYGETR